VTVLVEPDRVAAAAKAGAELQLVGEVDVLGASIESYMNPAAGDFPCMIASHAS
jgi:hypothetical protein